MERIDVRKDGCWIWRGRENQDGYGRLMAGGTTQLAHRYVYSQLVGPIPEGLQIDHLCRVRMCVNPEHLEPVTQRVSLNRGEGASHRAARADLCQSGRHRFSEVGFYVNAKGCRNCRACTSERNARNYRRRMGLDR